MGGPERKSLVPSDFAEKQIGQRRLALSLQGDSRGGIGRGWISVYLVGTYACLRMNPDTRNLQPKKPGIGEICKFGPSGMLETGTV